MKGADVNFIKIVKLCTCRKKNNLSIAMQFNFYTLIYKEYEKRTTVKFVNIIFFSYLKAFR